MPPSISCVALHPPLWRQNDAISAMFQVWLPLMLTVQTPRKIRLLTQKPLLRIAWDDYDLSQRMRVRFKLALSFTHESREMTPFYGIPNGDVFQDMDWSGVTFLGPLSNCEFNNCKLDHITFSLPKDETIIRDLRAHRWDEPMINSCKFNTCSFIDPDFQLANPPRSSYSGPPEFERARLSNSDFTNCNIRLKADNLHVLSCSFSECRVLKWDMRFGRIEFSQFSDSLFEDFKVDSVAVMETSFKDVDFPYITIHKSPFIHCVFEDVQMGALADSSQRRGHLINSTWDNQIPTPEMIGHGDYNPLLIINNIIIEDAIPGLSDAEMSSGEFCYTCFLLRRRIGSIRCPLIR